MRNKHSELDQSEREVKGASPGDSPRPKLPVDTMSGQISLHFDFSCESN